MKLLPAICSAAVAFETFEPLTNQLPNDLLGHFDCEGNGNGGRIVGGEFANKAWPFYVQFWSWKTQTQANNQPNNMNFLSCGGAIIHDRYILTAAHCCDVNNRAYHEMRFGTKKTLNDHKFSMGFTKDKMHIYPNWNGNPEKDACIVEMPSSISAMATEKCGGTCATRVCLPTAPAVPGDACWAGGHGVEDYSDDNSTPDTFKSAGQNIFSEAYAREHVKNSVLSDVDFQWMLIAGTPDNDGNGWTDAGTDSCSGDSGSGLVCREGNNLVMHGINSWGDNCGKEGKPGVWANVWKFKSWIEGIIGPQVTTTPEATTTKETTTKPDEETTEEPEGDCPEMQWKGKKATKIMYRGRENGKRTYILRQTVSNNGNNNDIRQGPYTGFFMFARRFCGTDFFEAVSNGEIELGMSDYEDTYMIKGLHTRIDGSKGTSVTVQYHQNRVGEADAPWSKKSGNNQKKDQFFLHISGIPDSWDSANEADCFKLMTGVLPSGFDHMQDWAQCAAEQKDAGW